MKNETIIPDLLGWTNDPQEVHRLSLRKEALYRQVIQKDGIEPLPGVTNFLKQLRSVKVREIIASSTHRLNITTTLEVIGLTAWFPVIVSAEDVHHGKPNPEIFLLAAEKIGVPPARCIVFEDAHVGIEAARAAGMKVVGVATTHPADTLKDTDRVVSRLDELDVEELGKWFGD